MHQLRSIRSECDIRDHDVVLMPRVPEPSHHRSDPLSNSLYTCCSVQFTFSTEPSVGRTLVTMGSASCPAIRPHPHPLYSPEEKRRRDATPWTLVQGILAPVQFLAFAVSLVLVLRYLATGEGLW